MTAVSIEEYSLLQAHDLYTIMPNLRLTTTERDVWDTILRHITEGYQAPVTRGEIAARLNIDPTYVSHATRPLKRAGLIFRRGKNDTVWYVNPQLVFKGSYDAWLEVLADLPEDTPELLVPDYEVRPPRRRERARLRVV